MTTRRNRQTGTMVTIDSADALGLDPCDGDCAWYTVCDDHGSVCGHTTRKLALYFAASPIDWCEDCAS